MRCQGSTPPKSADTVTGQENLTAASGRFALSARERAASRCYSQLGYARAVKGRANLKVRWVRSAQLAAGAGGRMYGRRKEPEEMSE